MAAAGRRSLGWRLHSWAGLNLCLFTTFVLATGTLAVFAHEMDWLANPARRASAPAVSASWGTLVTAAAQAVPGGRVLSVSMSPHAWLAPVALVETAAGDSLRLFLDPASGTVQGASGWVSFQQFFRQAHRRLMLPARYGVPIVSSAALLLLVSLLTGLVSYKRFWRGFALRPRSGGRRLAGDLHRLAGRVGRCGSWRSSRDRELVPRRGARRQGRDAEAAIGRGRTAWCRQGRPGAGCAGDRSLRCRGARRLPCARDPRGPISAEARRPDRIPGAGGGAARPRPRQCRVGRPAHGAAAPRRPRGGAVAAPAGGRDGGSAAFRLWGGIASKLVWFVFGLMLTALR